VHRREIKFFASPYTQQYRNSTFQYPHTGTAESPHGRWSVIPDGTDILVTCGPPFAYLGLAEVAEPYSRACGNSVGDSRQCFMCLDTFIPVVASRIYSGTRLSQFGRSCRAQQWWLAQYHVPAMSSALRWLQ
jgi:hypothetical protein